LGHQIFWAFNEALRVEGWHTIWTAPPYVQLLNPAIEKMYDGSAVLPMIRVWSNDEARTPDRHGKDMLEWLSAEQRASAARTPEDREGEQPVRFVPVPDGPDETFVLHRLNENRDNLRRDLTGTLVLAGGEDFLRRVPGDAPDLWSMREKSFELTPWDPIGAPAPKEEESREVCRSRDGGSRGLFEPAQKGGESGAPLAVPSPSGYGGTLYAASKRMGAVRRSGGFHEAPELDAFLSYSFHDEGVAEELRRRLEADGVRCAAADVSADPDPEALKASRFILVLLSPEWVHSGWDPFEEAARSASAPPELRGRLIPLQIRRAVVPGFLRQFVPIDWSTAGAREREYPKLLKTLYGRGRELPDAVKVVKFSRAAKTSASLLAMTREVRGPSFLGIKSGAGMWVLYLVALALAVLSILVSTWGSCFPSP
jgi:hypothetical protein